jgi:hypothetical protein
VQAYFGLTPSTSRSEKSCEFLLVDRKTSPWLMRLYMILNFNPAKRDIKALSYKFAIMPRTQNFL